MRSAQLASALCAVVLLNACSSGAGGTDVTIGSGQSADPVTLDFPVFYVKRPVPDAEAAVMSDARRLRPFEIGADLYMRARAAVSAPEINLTADITEDLGDVRDLDVSYDGQKVLFAMRARFIEDADEEDQPTWDIWEYDAAARQLRRVMTSDIEAEKGHDIMPHYLPDGRIVFSSTRQDISRGLLLDEGKPQFAAQDEDNREPAFVLHVMDADGRNIHQISFNQSHDLDPAVLADGRIVFTRWEHHSDDNQFDLYTVRPDGSELQLLYGAHSHATGTIDPQSAAPSVVQFMKPRPLPDGRTLALVRPFDGSTDEGGDLVLIDTANYVDNTTSAPFSAGLAGPAQTRALPTDVRTIEGPSPGGRYRAAFPLFDGTGRLLVSWSQCRLIEAGRITPCTSERLDDPDAMEAAPLYGLYVYDVRDNTQLPIVTPQEGFMFTEVAAGSQRTLPPVLLDRTAGVDYDAALQSENVGVLHIRSVYDIDGVDRAVGGIASMRNPANAATYLDENRPRFLRIEKAVSQPDDDVRDVPNTAFGPQGRGRGMREILGYAPIEPDGSVKVKVPANVALSISILDANGRRLSGSLGVQHLNWLQLQTGEARECNGCHAPGGQSPRAHGRPGLTTSVNAGAPSTGSPFLNTHPALFADSGETMAEVRNRVMCGGACALNVDPAFFDYWPANPAQATPIADACYSTAATMQTSPADLTQTTACRTGLPPAVIPTSSDCTTRWSARCRITIHYERHIHPLWSLDRTQDTDGDSIIDVDQTCTSCHAPVNALNQAAVAAGDLDLSDGPSEDEPDHFNAYRELLFADRGQFVNAMGQLEDECIETQTNPDTNVVTCVRFRSVPASMSANGARASARFFDTLEGRRVVSTDHRGFMSASELRLLAEWLDIGAQYYNDPFAAPEN